MNEVAEYFDLYDQHGHALGRSKRREEVHRDGDWHRSAHIWIYTGDGLLLFQRRALDKDTWPGYLDASVGGHYRAGESGAIGVACELDEELGIAVEPSELVKMGVRRVESLEPGIMDRELQDIYLVRRDLPPTAYRPDPVEIDGLVLLDAADAARLHEGALTCMDGAFLVRGAAEIERRAITAADLIPNRGPYIAAIARAVAELLAGRAPAPL